MAGNNLFERTKGIAVNAVGKNSQLGIIGKSIEEKMDAKSKLYGYIGMEVCDLRAAGKMNVPELQGYFEKLQTLDDELRELQAQKQQLELQSGSGTTCICGGALTLKDKFCPRCGTPVNNGMITCVCGNQVAKNMRFCNACGRDIQQGLVLMQPNVTPVPAQPKCVKQCICGAQVSEGQFMCMECGRKIEQ